MSICRFVGFYGVFELWNNREGCLGQDAVGQVAVGQEAVGQGPIGQEIVGHERLFGNWPYVKRPLDDGKLWKVV